MFWNIYSKRVIGTLRDREMIVWTWAFPILLSTLFFFTFTSLDTVSQLQVILLGVVDNTAYREDVAFSAALGAVSEQNDSQLFELTRLDSVEQGDALLQEGAIDAYLFVEDVPRLVVTSDGMSQTIAKGFLDRYLQTKSAVETLLRESPEAAERLPLLMGADSLTREISLTDAVPTDKVNYFYALLAMVCMYGGFQGIHSISYLQANLSPLGARRTMAPVGRFRLITADLLGGITVHFLCLLLVVAYIALVLGVSFGSQSLLVILTCLVGSLMGVAFGALVGVSSRLKETAKTAVVISVTMVCCFLSGLMVTGINYMVAQQAPILAFLNPAAHITDAFYCLYYYDSYDRYLYHIAVLLVMTVVMLAITSLFVRRQRYESI